MRIPIPRRRTRCKRPSPVPWSLPDPAQTQGIERVVKKVTATSQALMGYKKRDLFIRGRAAHRELMPVFSSNKDLAEVQKLRHSLAGARRDRWCCSGDCYFCFWRVTSFLAQFQNHRSKKLTPAPVLPNDASASQSQNSCGPSAVTNVTF